MKKLVVMITLLFTLASCGVSTEPKQDELPKDVSARENIDVELSGTVDVNKYYIYGEHLLIEGKFEENVTEAKLVVADKEFPLEIKEDMSFEIDGKFDQGVPLYGFEDMAVEMYIHATVDGTEKNYSLKNVNTEMKDLELYTVLRNGSRKHVNVVALADFMYLDVEEVTDLPEDVYDIIIDPGHGGLDKGADYNIIEPEKVYSLRSSLYMKELFEKAGYKVAMTRTEDIHPGTNDKVDPYYENGRVDLVYKSNAKYSISNHLNALRGDGVTRGAEVYSTIHTSTAFAKALADGLISGGLEYSNRDIYFKFADGVYKRKLLVEEMRKEENSAIANGYKYYESVAEFGAGNTDYYFMIRETGGIATHANRDGRDTRYSANTHYLSQVGVENFTIEYAYIDHKEDALNIDQNIEKAVDGLVDAFINYINAQ